LLAGIESLPVLCAKIHSCKRPSEIIVVEALATSTGKMLKHKLAESLHT
jgi:hypothetical protein